MQLLTVDCSQDFWKALLWNTLEATNIRNTYRTVKTWPVLNKELKIEKQVAWIYLGKIWEYTPTLIFYLFMQMVFLLSLLSHCYIPSAAKCGFSYFLSRPIFSYFCTIHGVLTARILEWLAIPSPVDHILSELSTMTHPCWVALHSMAHSFIELCKHVRSLSYQNPWFLELGASGEIILVAVSYFLPYHQHCFFKNIFN